MSHTGCVTTSNVRRRFLVDIRSDRRGSSSLHQSLRYSFALQIVIIRLRAVGAKVVGTRTLNLASGCYVSITVAVTCSKSPLSAIA